MKRVYLIALIVALAVGGATYFFAQGLIENSRIQDAPTKTVLVATEDVQAGTMITAEMKDTIFVMKNVLAEDAISNAVLNFDDIVGKVVAQNLLAEEQVNMMRVVERGSDDAALSYSLLEGEVAYSIKASADQGVDGYITPGDIIDIVVALENEDGDVTGGLILFNDLEVLKVATYQEVDTAKQDTTGDGQVKTYTSVTVKTTEAEAANLYAMEAEAGAGFKLILNSRTDAENTK